MTKARTAMAAAAVVVSVILLPSVAGAQTGPVNAGYCSGTDPLIAAVWTLIDEAAKAPASSPAGQPGPAGPPTACTHPDPSLLAAYNSGAPLTQQQWLDLIGPYAYAAQLKTGVPAADTIAQSIQEEGWGQGAYSMHNNAFGIKGTGDAGGTWAQTQEYGSGGYYTTTSEFAAYSSLAAAVQAHDQLLASSGYYPDAMRAGSDPYAFARGLQTDGYATDPSYGAELQGLITEYDLTRFDHCGLQP